MENRDKNEFDSEVEKELRQLRDVSVDAPKISEENRDFLKRQAMMKP